MNVRRKTPHLILKLLPFVLILLLGAGLLWELRQADRRTKESQAIAAQATVEKERPSAVWQGKTYYLREDLKKYVLIGIDENEAQSNKGGTAPSQADFVAVLVVDEAHQNWSLLQLNRDTMCNVPLLSAQGKAIGSQRQQLALAHTYGADSSDNCRNTVQAVENLLYGVPMDGYIRIRMDAIAKLNDAVGGVTVELQDDFTEFDEDMYPGAVLTLSGNQAELFVRARSGMPDATNLNRMERQKQYLSAWVEKAREAENPSAVIEGLSNDLYSDLSIYRISGLADLLKAYPVPDVCSPSGTVKKGTAFIEFDVNEDALQQQVIDLFYEPKENET